jgi:lipoprotein-releasing system permease protein
MFALKVAWRYLTANLVQTGLLIAGVALSVIVFVFMTALVTGLANFLVERTTANIAHVTLEPPIRVARVLTADDTLAARPVSTFQRLQIRSWQQVVAVAENLPGVRAVSAQIAGNGFMVRGQAVQAVAVVGVEPDQLSSIAPIEDKMIDGTSDLTAGGLVIGATLAENLGLRAGQPVRLQSDRGASRLITITGVYRVGLSSLDERVAFLSLQLARPLFDLPNGVTTIEIRLTDPEDAPGIAETLKAGTNLKVVTWQEKNLNLKEALAGQGRTGSLIQVFALISIIIAIASALLLTTYRRRSEIGIMRSFGISRRFVASVFVLQGLIVGLVGSLLGSFVGYWLCVALTFLRDGQGNQDLPIDPSQGGYVAVITLATLGAMLAAILPARAAARVDPVEAIHQ